MYQTVRAKFKVDRVTPPASPGQYVNLELRPVYSDDPDSENKAFWEATPSGYLQMSVRPDAAALFEEGREFYLDFTPVE